MTTTRISRLSTAPLLTTHHNHLIVTMAAPLRTALRRAALGGECACNPARVALTASRAARFSSVARPAVTVAPRFTIPARAFSVTPARYSKVQRDAWAADPIIGFEEVKGYSQQPTDNVLLVDVREPDEVALGSIPSAVNIPLSRLAEVLSTNYHPGDFQKVSRAQPDQTSDCRRLIDEASVVLVSADMQKERAD